MDARRGRRGQLNSTQLTEHDRLLLLASVLGAAHLLGLLELLDARAELAHGLDHERHGEVHDVVAPGELEYDVRAEQVVALVQASAEALVELLVQEPGDEILGELDLLGLAGVAHGVLVETVGLAQLDRLLPSVVALVEVGRYAAELDERVLLESLGQIDVVEVVVGVDAVAQALEVLLLHEQIVERLVDRLVVVVLHRAEIGLDERQVVGLDEEVDGARMVEARREHGQQVVEQHGLVVQVELDGLVVELDVGHLRDHVLEVVLAPRLGRVSDHGRDRVVVLLVLVVEEDQLRPQVRLLGGAQHLFFLPSRICKHDNIKDINS